MTDEQVNSLLLGFSDSSQLSISTLIISLFVGLLLSILIRWHYKNFGSTLSNREEFSQVFPFILLTTVLIITVVKSSIALSLGLVGALSIVRFRTPIKEPEELAYLFISIAAGLGLGAGQHLTTVSSITLILLFMAILRKKWKSNNVTGKNLFISIDLDKTASSESNDLLEDSKKIILKYTRSVDIRRYDVRENSIDILYLVDFSDANSLTDIVTEIEEKYHGVGITFLDQNNLPSV
jgi:uncharacterized membrane protein YhiD involved in acid resistance